MVLVLDVDELELELLDDEQQSGHAGDVVLLDEVEGQQVGLHPQFVVV